MLKLVAQGLTDAQVARKLTLSPRTINAHMQSIFGKLEVTSRNAATRWALEHGLAEDEEMSGNGYDSPTLAV